MLYWIRLYRTKNQAMANIFNGDENRNAETLQDNGRQQLRPPMYPTHSPKSPLSTPSLPSSPMADYVDQWAAAGRKNIFGTTVKVQEMQAESGAAGAVHGALNAGASDHDLHRFSGSAADDPEHVQDRRRAAARRVPRQRAYRCQPHPEHLRRPQRRYGLPPDRFCDAGRDQRSGGHGPFPRRSPRQPSRAAFPFLNFFDGFRTSHELQKIQVWDYDDLKDMVDMDAVEAFRARALNSEHPAMRGSHENGDIFFQNREASNKYYDAVPAIVEEYMGKINAKLGTDYQLFNYYGAPDADRVIVAHGLHLRRRGGSHRLSHRSRREGRALSRCRLYRPFCPDKLIAAIPATCQEDRSPRPHQGARRTGRASLPRRHDRSAQTPARPTFSVIGGRYGLGSKDTPPASVFAVYNELKKDDDEASVHHRHR